jgi:predicted phosphodiesterase
MVQRGSRVAAIYDVHGNLPALEEIPVDFASVNPDLVVGGGDVVAGPMPTEVLDRLAALSESVCLVRGNADREVVAAYDTGRYADALDAATLRSALLPTPPPRSTALTGTYWPPSPSGQTDPNHRVLGGR